MRLAPPKLRPARSKSQWSASRRVVCGTAQSARLEGVLDPGGSHLGRSGSSAGDQVCDAKGRSAPRRAMEVHKVIEPETTCTPRSESVVACGPWLRCCARMKCGEHVWRTQAGARAADLRHSSALAFVSNRNNFQIETNSNRARADRRAAAALGAEPVRSASARIAKHLRRHRASAAVDAISRSVFRLRLDDFVNFHARAARRPHFVAIVS
jgi:hypothetical protein